MSFEVLNNASDFQNCRLTNKPYLLFADVVFLHGLFVESFLHWIPLFFVTETRASDR